MVSSSFRNRLRDRIEWVPEDPGSIVLLVLILLFLAMTPKTGCSFAPDAPAAEAQTPATH
jgi:hypothetical protein